MLNKEESLAKISKDLMLKEPFYGFFLIMLNKVWNMRGVSTAAVCKNGINYQIGIDEEFWNNLTDFEKLGILKHELLHIAFFHLTNYHKYSDKKLANVAMDMEINQYIDSNWLPTATMTKDEYDDKYEPIIEKLKEDYKAENITKSEYIKEIKKIPGRPILIQDYSDLNLDLKAGTRYYYDKLKEAKDKKSTKGSSGCESFDKLCDQMDIEGDPCNHDIWEEFDNLSEAEKKVIEKQIDRLLQNAADISAQKTRGHVPGEMKDYLLELNKVIPPKFDWRGYIRRFTGTSTKIFTKKLRRKHNKRYEGNPGLKIKMKQHMLLGIDTSGSVSNDELLEFMNEINHIYNTGVDITIVQCDAAIVSIEAYDRKSDIKIGGRGGTSFDPVLDYYNANLKKFTSLVYFTDGEAWTNIKPKAPVLWVLSECSNMNEELPGRVIKLEL